MAFISPRKSVIQHAGENHFIVRRAGDAIAIAGWSPHSFPLPHLEVKLALSDQGQGPEGVAPGARPGRIHARGITTMIIRTHNRREFLRVSASKPRALSLPCALRPHLGRRDPGQERPAAARLDRRRRPGLGRCSRCTRTTAISWPSATSTAATPKRPRRTSASARGRPTSTKTTASSSTARTSTP